MHREIKITGDGSPTLFIPELNEHYHSVHGAWNESMHVFIRNGLHYQLEKIPGPLQILEIGFGTGLNTIMTYIESEFKKIVIQYHTIEPFPLEHSIIQQLEFPQITQQDIKHTLLEMHITDFNMMHTFSENFSLIKYNTTLEKFQTDTQFHLIYFDAYGPRVQPEIWSGENFKKLFDYVLPGGVLTTYCSKGDVRRAMLAAGFLVEKLHGPPGKREMLRALKPQ